MLAYSRLMLQAETLTQRGMLLRVLQNTDDTGCLKRFLSLHGLRLLWSWMVELTNTSSRQVLDTQLQVIPPPPPPPPPPLVILLPFSLSDSTHAESSSNTQQEHAQ